LLRYQCASHFTLQSSFNVDTRERQLPAITCQVGNSALQAGLCTNLFVNATTARWHEGREKAFQRETLLNKVNRSVARSKMTEVTTDMIE